MFRVIAWQTCALAAAAVIAAGLAWGEWRYFSGKAAGRAAVIAEFRQAAEDTRRMVRDADTGTGDHDDDLRWLAERLRAAAAD